MAELAAIGLAGNIVQFVQFGTNLFREGREFYRSAQGATTKDLELETVTQDLRHFAKELHTIPQAEEPTIDQIHLRNNAKDCILLATELLQLLEQLRITDQHNRKWNSFKLALIRVAKQRKINELEGRLQRLHEYFSRSVVVDLRNQHSDTLKILRRLQEQNTVLENKAIQKLEDIRSELVVNREAQNYTRSLTGIGEGLIALAEEGRLLKKQQEVLRGLEFDRIKVRYNAVQKAHTETFKWIFESSNSTFMHWIRSGEGIYWIEGKAGSGKSTLMKYLANHSQTYSGLQEWAGDRKLSIGAHFFWNAGSSLQKSEEGLLRTLLYQIFRDRPRLIEKICDEGEDFGYGWDHSKLRDAFEKLSRVHLLSESFCFFIDGLDEYSSDHRHLIHTVQEMTVSSSIKVCASSRPWNVFTDAFGNSEQKLKLEELTRNDITTYVQYKLGQNTNFWGPESTDCLRTSIVSDITQRAQGVFLWVYLVVDSLDKGLTNGDNMLELRRRLDQIPDGLEEYFKHMINTIEVSYRQASVAFFKVAVAALQDLPLLAYKFLEETQNPNFALKAPTNPYEDSRITVICETMKKRLNARCKDLLEVQTGPSESSFLKYRVNFLHRTVRDFFRNTTEAFEMWEEWMSDLDTEVSLCRITLALVKALPQNDMKAISKNRARLNSWFSPLLSFADEFFYHAREIETQYIHGSKNDKSRLFEEYKLLDELDRAST